MCSVCDEVFRYHNDGSMCRCYGCNKRREAGYPAPVTLTELYGKAGNSMAMVALCDRCGHMGLSTTFGTLMWRFTDADQQSAKNVCPGCVAEFWAFVTGKGGERPPEPYREPFRVIDPKPEESESFVDNLASRLLARLEGNRQLESGSKVIRESDE
jgi:hypothetical protein